MMKRFSLFILFALFHATLFAQGKIANQLAKPLESSSQERTIDRIVAIVNDEAITQIELRDRVRLIESQLTTQGTPLPPRGLLEKQVLERLVLERIQMQMAKSLNIRVDDTQLDRAIARIAEQSSTSLQDFRARIEKSGTPFVQFREEVRNEIVLTRLREREVDNQIQISEGEIDALLSEQSGLAFDAQEINIAQILLRIPEQASPAQIAQQSARAEDLYRQAIAGADFAKLAASFSDASEALSGGELGWRFQDRLPQLFVEAVASLQPNEIAKPVRSPNGFHILKLLGRRSAAGRGVITQQTHARHILLRVSEVLSATQARQQLAEIKRRIESGATSFADMARQYSADASASRGGDLGNLYPGDTVPDFERAMDALAPAQISDPIESPFGWHLIQVVERKTQELPQERQRLIARQVLRERKIDEAYRDWLLQIRDRAYVELRLDEK